MVLLVSSEAATLLNTPPTPPKTLPSVEETADSGAACTAVPVRLARSQVEMRADLTSTWWRVKVEREGGEGGWRGRVESQGGEGGC